MSNENQKSKIIGQKLTYGFYPGCTYTSSAGYKESVEAVNRILGIDFIEISAWNCCGATSIFSLDEAYGLALVGRVFALANQQGLNEIVTVCNACYTTLRKGSKILTQEPEKISRVNEELGKEQLQIKKLLPVRHYLEVLSHDIPDSVWQEKCIDDIKKIKVAAYYGCQLTRPWADIDHPERPQMLDQFIQKLGFIPIEHSAKTMCCGASNAVPYPKECRVLIDRILGEMHRKGAQCITTLCPLCQFNLDAMQDKNDIPLIPIPYFTQLTGLALGLSERELGIKKLLVPLKNL